MKYHVLREATIDALDKSVERWVNEFKYKLQGGGFSSTEVSMNSLIGPNVYRTYYCQAVIKED